MGVGSLKRVRKFVFVHLPKTAGTSFNRAFKDILGDGGVSPHFTASYLTDADATALERYRIIQGHISMADVRRYFPDRSILTILREPVDRCVSWYFHARRSAPATSAILDVHAAQIHGLDDFFALGAATVYRNIFNRQVRQLGDHALNPEADHAQALDRAKSLITSAAWVGRQETITADLATLAAAFPEFSGLRLRMLNTSPERLSLPAISAATLDNVRRLNCYDVELYDFATRQSGRGTEIAGR